MKTDVKYVYFVFRQRDNKLVWATKSLYDQVQEREVAGYVNNTVRFHLYCEGHKTIDCNLGNVSTDELQTLNIINSIISRSSQSNVENNLHLAGYKKHDLTHLTVEDAIDCLKSLPGSAVLMITPADSFARPFSHMTYISPEESGDPNGPGYVELH